MLVLFNTPSIHQVYPNMQKVGKKLGKKYAKSMQNSNFYGHQKEGIDRSDKKKRGASVCWGPKCSTLLHDSILQKNYNILGG